MSLRDERLEQLQTPELKLFCHCIYDYKKGVRKLLLTTEKSCHSESIIQRLNRENIDFLIQDASKNTINVFFGAKECVDIVKTFVDKKLNTLTPEQDFMLGTMLGYDSLTQCSRYLEKIGSVENTKAS